ncbi:MAG TPA: malto-oligosyltrehalose synthase [Gemmatimonadaceae bacterium]|nr:malto-oligosyltrehalose synthase [Gemmatimonadaceae bacterium]
MSRRALTATYRLQLSAAFTLHDARSRVPYLRRLGVSHLYCSPVLAARAGSTHGYDVADPTFVSQELGGNEAFVALADAAHAHDMGIVLDIVPNHMGIGPDNPYWEDLLTHGQGSRYASWFDVQWRAPTRRLAGKVLLPILGDEPANVIERDELAVEIDERGARVRYFDHEIPLDPATLPPELELAMRDPSARLAVVNWTHGAKGHERLRALLAKQHYELAFWRDAQRDVNYRRFFDVNELICLRVEREDVFEATHRLVLQFVAEGLIDGLRVDHVDGLLEPRRYLERLRHAVEIRRPAVRRGEPFPILVEKILAEGERLPDDWPVDGTTGYEFMTALEDVLIDPSGYAALESGYRGPRGEPDFPTVAVDSKRRVLRSTLNADVRRIAPMLAAVARQAAWPRLTIAAYAGAIVELVAVLPVYRTYIDAERPEAGERDREILVRAFAQVRERAFAEPAAVDALERALLGEWRAAEEEVARARLSFVLRWQQLTGPAAAKGVEDTALYVYAPLASRNEVGGDPGVPLAGAVERLHDRLGERAATMPRSLNALNTHDTKRSADVRARLDAISENPVAWARRLRAWRRRNRALHELVRGRITPLRRTDNFIYQALIGLWPSGTEPRGEALAELRERLKAYMLKAVREAKLRTSWTDPDTEYERAIETFITRLLDEQANERFLRDVAHFVATLAPQGRWNSLAQVAVQLTAPGVPDTYQGAELWFRALVDPDNRRPVDWDARDLALDRLHGALAPGAEASAAHLAEWCARAEDDGLKLYLVSRLLHLRLDHAALFTQGSYVPLHAEGAHASRAVAFARTHARETAVVIVPRLTCGLGGTPLADAWGDTRLSLAPGESGGAWTCRLSGAVVQAADGTIALSAALKHLPVAVLMKG